MVTVEFCKRLYSNLSVISNFMVVEVINQSSFNVSWFGQQLNEPKMGKEFSDLVFFVTDQTNVKVQGCLFRAQKFRIFFENANFGLKYDFCLFLKSLFYYFELSPFIVRRILIL